MLKRNSGHKTQIIFSSDLPVEGSGILLHYNHFQVKVDGWETVDAREVIIENEEKWLSEIDTWHRSLIEDLREISKWWPLFSVSRLVLWKAEDDFSLKPILFATSIAELIESEKPSVIRILEPSNELIQYVCEWGKANENISITNKQSSTLKVFLLFKSKVLIGFRFVKIILKMLWIKSFGKNKKIKPATIIVNSNMIDPGFISKIGDHYFGYMIDELNISSNKDIAWIYNDVFFDRQSAEKELRKIERTAYFISDLIEWKDLLFSLIECSKSIFNIKKVLQNSRDLHVGNLFSGIFSRAFISTHIYKRTPFIEFMLYSTFKRILKQSGADFIIYPYEERPVEHAILMAASDCKSNIKTRGFAHGAYSLGHLYIRRKELGNPLYPDMIAVTGPLVKKRFVDLGVPSNEIVVVGTPRYQEKQKDYSFQVRSSSLKILFITGLGYEMELFADLLINNRDLSEKHEIKIRRSPHSWSESEDKAENLLKKQGINYQCNKSDLIDDIDNADVIIYESTSAAFQASLRGKIIIQMQLSEILPTKHFYKIHGPNEIIFCKNPDDLRKNLDCFASMTKDQYNDYAKRQRKQVEALFSKKSKETLKALFLDSND